MFIVAPTTPDARIATNDIGAIAYFSHRFVIDTEGLVTPEAIHPKRMRYFVPFLESERPDLLEPEPETFFLAADENKTIDLKVVRVADLNLETTVDPNPPPASDPFTAVVFVYAGSVSDQGTLLAIPRASLPVLLTVGTGLQIQGAPMSVTDANGRVAYRLRCLAAGQQGADLILANVRMSLGLPPCPG